MEDDESEPVSMYLPKKLTTQTKHMAGESNRSNSEMVQELLEWSIPRYSLRLSKAEERKIETIAELEHHTVPLMESLMLRKGLDDWEVPQPNANDDWVTEMRKKDARSDTPEQIQRRVNDYVLRALEALAKKYPGKSLGQAGTQLLREGKTISQIQEEQGLRVIEITPEESEIREKDERIQELERQLEEAKKTVLDLERKKLQKE
jgi:hypothetical protein